MMSRASSIRDSNTASAFWPAAKAISFSWSTRLRAASTRDSTPSLASSADLAMASMAAFSSSSSRLRWFSATSPMVSSVFLAFSASASRWMVAPSAISRNWSAAALIRPRRISAPMAAVSDSSVAPTRV